MSSRIIITETRPHELWEFKLNDAAPWVPDSLIIARLSKRAGFDGVVYDYNLEYRIPWEPEKAFHRVITAESEQNALEEGMRALLEDAENCEQDARDQIEEFESEAASSGGERASEKSKVDTYDCYEVACSVFNAITTAFAKGHVECPK